MSNAKSEVTPANLPNQPAAGKGRPARAPDGQGPQVNKQMDFKDESVRNSLELPHDRDEAQDMTNRQPDPLMDQARKDVANGLKDTSKGVETDKTYEKFRAAK